MILCLCSVPWLMGCGGGGTARKDDPLTAIRDPNRSALVRLRAAQALPEEIRAGRVPLWVGREALIDLAWLRRLPTTTRVAAVKSLFTLQDEESVAASREMVLAMLPTERDVAVAEHLSFEAANRKWYSCTGAIVRSFSTVNDRVPDAERPEPKAIEALYPDRPVAEVVFDIFLKPTGPWGGSQRIESDGLEHRVRRDAWDLLARLDRDGTIRVRLLSELVLRADVSGDPELEALRAGLEEASVIPLTGDELEWLVAMRSGEHERWWRRVREAVRSLTPTQRRGLRLRHLETLRWVSMHRAGWLTLTREELLARLTSRLEGRENLLPTLGVRTVSSESLADWSDKLSWSDLLTFMTLDESLRDRRVLAGLAAYVAEDRADRSTEYGGLIVATDGYSIEARSDSEFAARLYRPRPVTRVGDNRFVASKEMLGDSTTALAHYHLHVQSVRNARYAGPSRGDLEYAARYGRACLVLTSIAPNLLNADAYTPGGAVVDLGIFTIPTPPATADAQTAR